MKKGDVVVINDGSFSKQIKDNKLVHGPGGDKYKGGPRKQYIVIETGCSFPNTGGCNSFNNTVIQAIDSGKVVFTEERFLELVSPKHKIMIDVVQVDNYTSLCGPIVEISDELYRKIKNES